LVAQKWAKLGLCPSTFPDSASLPPLTESDPRETVYHSSKFCCQSFCWAQTQSETQYFSGQSKSRCLFIDLCPFLECIVTIWFIRDQRFVYNMWDMWTTKSGQCPNRATTRRDSYPLGSKLRG
jgi:hypothetical protein